MAVYTPTGLKKIFHDSRRFIAKHWLTLQPAIQIAITGSQGKTNTTKIITEITSSLGKTVVTDTNLDTTFNVPITALKVNPATNYVVWELGIDHIGEMDNHLQIATPSIGIITGISPVHTDAEHMGSLEKLIEQKRRLIEVLPTTGFAILNYDDEHVRGMAPFTKAQVLWYGTNSEQCTVWLEHEKNGGKIIQTIDGLHAQFHDGEENFAVKTPLIGLHHGYNLMAGYLVLKILMQKINPQITVKEIAVKFQTIVSHLLPLRGRMSIEKGPKGITILNDSLRANPASTISGLTTLAQMEYTAGRKIAVIGEMGELAEPEEEHAQTGELIASLPIDYVVCIGPLRKFTVDTAIEKGFPADKILYAKDIFEAKEQLETLLQPGDLMYLKGSFLRNYKRIIQLLNGEEICCNAIMCPYSHCGYKE